MLMINEVIECFFINLEVFNFSDYNVIELFIVYFRFSFFVLIDIIGL